jgi:hypothetical protein
VSGIPPREIHKRKLIFLLVFLSHCALIYVVERSVRTHRSAAKSPYETLLVFFINKKEEKDSSSVADPGSAKARVSNRQALSVPPSNPPQQISPDVASSNAITDWYSMAQSVAKDTVERERDQAAKRAFEHKIPPTEREKASIFDPAPVRRAGTWDGPNRFYVTDNCFYEYDRAPPPPPTALDNRLKTPTCKRPPKGGGDAMFKDLTPDYLKDLPKPKAH